MFNQLLKLVKEHAGEAIINNPAIPNQHNDAAIKTAATGIMDQLKNVVKTGGVSSLTGLLASKSIESNPLIQGISSNVTGELMKKFGLDKGQAGAIVQKLIPVVMSQFVSKTNDPKDNSFDVKNIVSSLSGGGGILSGISKIFGSKK